MAIGITLGGRPCLDPNTIREACIQDGLPTDWYGKPNRYSCPNGLEPGSGYLLMAKSDYDQLDPAKTHALIFASEYGTVSFPGIMLCGFPRNLYPGADNPPLLVEITDTRCNLLTVTNQRYTWRATPDQTDANNEMTWGEVIEDLWGRLGLTDAFPGLNPLVNGIGLTMEQYDCHGFKVANALEDVLTALGCCLSYNPFFNNYAAAYLPGVVDQSQVFGRLFRNNLIHDDTPYNSARQFNVPNTIRVQFPVWSANPDTSELAVYAKDVAVASSAATYPANRRGAVILQDNQPLRIDADGNLLNQTLIDDRAVAVATAFIDRLKITAPIIPISQIYRGFLDGTWAKPGEQFDLVVWMETGNGPMTAVFRAGMQGTIPIYQSNSLGSDGLKESAFEYDLLYDQGIAQRVGGVVPTPSRQFQNEGWWYQPTERMQRLFGTGLGPYMFRTQNLRYGDWASDSAGGYGDHRGHLIRPYENQSSPNGDTVICWILTETGEGTDSLYWPCVVADQSDADPELWGITTTKGYLIGSNKETLQGYRKYIAKKDNNGVTFSGSFGVLPVYSTFCCDGGTVTPPPCPLCPEIRPPYCPPCLTCCDVPINIKVPNVIKIDLVGTFQTTPIYVTRVNSLPYFWEWLLPSDDPLFYEKCKIVEAYVYIGCKTSGDGLEMFVSFRMNGPNTSPTFPFNLFIGCLPATDLLCNEPAVLPRSFSGFTIISGENLAPPCTPTMTQIGNVIQMTANLSDGS